MCYKKVTLTTVWKTAYRGNRKPKREVTAVGQACTEW